MKRIETKKIEHLKELKESGVKFVYCRIRKVFSSWYVRVFNIDALLEEKSFPSYWYKGKGDMTENAAIKAGYKKIR